MSSIKEVNNIMSSQNSIFSHLKNESDSEIDEDIKNIDEETLKEHIKNQNKNRITNKEINEVIVSYKDRLARFGIELIERFINYSDGKLIILNSYDNSPQEELTKDLVLIMNVFSAKLNGPRRYINKY